MTKCRLWGAALLGLLATCAAHDAALAQSAAPAAPKAAPDSRLDAQRTAFLAMPEADRKAAQDALGWLGFYNGAVDGAFGKRTSDAILAYQASVNASADGVVSPSQLAALKAEAQKARATVGFEAFDDPRTGIRIGAPLKLLSKRVSVGTDTRLARSDGAVALDLHALSGPDADLAALYARLSAESPARKVTYKATKPDAFFVVAGEEAGRKFYLRYAKAPAGASDPQAVRGFAFAYPAAQAGDLDRVALAIANSFEPFPPPMAEKPDTAVNGSPAVVKTPPAPASTPSGPRLAATALVVAPGEALTALREADCANPSIDGKPAKFERADAASGLALLAGDFGAPAPAPRSGAAGTDAIVLSFAPGKAALEASDATVTAALDGRQAVVAALTRSGSGAPAFDRRGALAGVVAPVAAEPKRVAGVVIAEPHALIGAETVKAFVSLASADASAPALGAAEIARAMRAAVVGVFCRP